MPERDFILETKNLTKDFGGIKAVTGLNLKVRTGDIHALIGPNGAGKTTVFNLLTGFLPSTSGEILFDGESVAKQTPAALSKRGLVRSFQISAVFAEFSALENVRVALQERERNAYAFWKSDRTLQKLNDRAMEILELVGLKDFHATPAGELAYGRKRVLEIATTLATDPKVMLLDEPTQGMGHEDVGRITSLIANVAKNRTILMVEHNLKVVSDLAARITVLQRGQILSEGTYAEVSSDARVMEAYMGAAENV